MLFRELALIVEPIDKKVSEEMGRVFDSEMPEKHYMDKISDLEHKLYRAESILKKIVKKSIKPTGGSVSTKTVGYNETVTYFRDFNNK
jgi:hypothetical protein